MQEQATEAGPAEWLDESARQRLVRLCARLSGSATAADDLVQETLLEAWRHRSRLTDPTGADRWLAAIARHVCRRAARSEARDRSRLTSKTTEPVEDDSVEEWFERGELAELLEQALAALPPTTRELVVQRYVDGAPTRQLAERHGLTPDAVSMRLGRGRAALRQVLGTELRAAAAAYDVPGSASYADWSATRLWCPSCGVRTLLMQREPPPGRVAFRCPGCDPSPSQLGTELALSNPVLAALVSAAVRPSTILSRLAGWSRAYYAGAAGSKVSCTRCGRPVTVDRYVRSHVPAGESHQIGLWVSCRCGESVSSSLGGLALSHPAVRGYRRQHPRLRCLPAREVSAAGSPSLVLGYRDVLGTSGVDVVFGRDRLDVRAVHPIGGWTA